MSATMRPAVSGEADTMPAPTMNAIVCDRYGPPESLKLEDTVRPAPDDDRVLVRVRAVSINPADLHNFGGGLIVRMTSGMQRPRTRIPWSDVAGVVEAVGRNVTVLRPGDEVFGTCAGSLAEYALGGKNLVPMPAGMTFEQAAALPIAGITALQGLRDKGRLQPGQSVLINGAAGGVGTFAVQIAKALGAEVTGVCSTRNADMVRSIGADDVVDYTREDFARRGKRYDLVFDLVGNRSLSALRRAAKPGGTLVLSGGAHDRGHGGRGMVRPLMLAARGLVLSKFVAEKIVFFIAQINKEDLLTLKELGEAGKVRPVIDRTCPLDAAPEAFRYLKTGHVSGKVVITV